MDPLSHPLLLRRRDPFPWRVFGGARATNGEEVARFDPAGFFLRCGPYVPVSLSLGVFVREVPMPVREGGKRIEGGLVRGCGGGGEVVVEDLGGGG